MLWHNRLVLKGLTSNVKSSFDHPIKQLPFYIWVKLDYEQATFKPLKIFDTIDSLYGEDVDYLVVTHKDQYHRFFIW